MPDKSQTQPEIRVVAEYGGDPRDPHYHRIVQLVINTIATIGLVRAEDDTELATMQLEQGRLRAVVVVIHDLYLGEGEHEDACLALLGAKAPLVQWSFPTPESTEDSISLLAVYADDTPVESINVTL